MRLEADTNIGNAPKDLNGLVYCTESTQYICLYIQTQQIKYYI